MKPHQADGILVAAVGEVSGRAVAAEAALVAAGEGGVATVLTCRSSKRRATLLNYREAGVLRDLFADAGLSGVEVCARGRLCFVDMDEAISLECIARVLDLIPESCPFVLELDRRRYRTVLEGLSHRFGRLILVPDQSSGETGELVAEIAFSQAADLVPTVELCRGAPGRIASRRLLAGLNPCLGKWPARRRPERAGQSGQATPLVLGAVFVLVLAATALVLITGAITGKARAQTAADLSALSAVASMKDDLPRLLAPPTLPNGLPNPAHISKAQYLARARFSGVKAAVGNGVSPLRLSFTFPDRISFAPVRVRVAVRSSVRAGGSPGSTSDWAEARLGSPIDMGVVPAVASGGGYSGSLAERQGQGMRPDIAVAFDAMSAAAAGAGVTLSISSAFRSDAEQAALFAANPDPTWVARPGTSLHRCGTELDLGPPASYGWLAANAKRFGFVQRYSWESWHYGFNRGPGPCSAAGNSISAADPRAGPTGGLPAFVPARFRRLILAASMKWGVSAALLAGQLYAESNFDPDASSPAGAQGIAQFMPSTAAAYGLVDPFDPVAAIDAQGHLMSDLLKQFGSPALALAAYNAGPGAVAPCNCIPDYPETQAYVAKIMALLGGLGTFAPMPMEVALVR